MKINPDAPTTSAVFRTDEGDYKVSLFSNEGKLKFKLAQIALKKLAKLSDSVSKLTISGDNTASITSAQTSSNALMKNIVCKE